MVDLAYLYQSEKPQRFCLCNCIGERDICHTIISTRKEDEAFIRFDFEASSYVVVFRGVTVLVAFR
jgi:hypothetical protein